MITFTLSLRSSKPMRLGVVKVTNLKVKLFGEFGVWRGEDPIEGEEWGGQKPRSLLKLLLTRPGHAFSKDEIVEALQAEERRQKLEDTFKGNG